MTRTTTLALALLMGTSTLAFAQADPTTANQSGAAGGASVAITNDEDQATQNPTGEEVVIEGNSLDDMNVESEDTMQANDGFEGEDTMIGEGDVDMDAMDDSDPAGTQRVDGQGTVLMPDNAMEGHDRTLDGNIDGSTN